MITKKYSCMVVIFVDVVSVVVAAVNVGVDVVIFVVDDDVVVAAVNVGVYIYVAFVVVVLTY